jgi:antitoxin (DNA-binding transcriptional repressor) of toxin-antitoxin stability system
MIHLSVAEAQQRLPDLLTAASQGEVVQIYQGGQEFQLCITSPRPVRPKAGRLKGQVVVADDFDEPLEELREYME